MLAGCDKPPPEPQVVTHGKFSEVKVYHNDGNAKPPVLLVSDDQGEATLTRHLIEQFLGNDIDVIAISDARLQQDFPGQLKNCNSLTGDFENLTRYVEAYLEYPRYITPMLANTPATNSAINRVLTPLVQKIFLGRLSFYADKPVKPASDLGACPPRTTSVKVAPAPTFSMPLQGKQADDALLEQTYAELEERMPATQDLDSVVADLPLTEVPAKGDYDTMAILLSGDGGWAGFDKDLADALQAKGVSVVGWDSLRYFWKATTADSVAADLDKVIAYYLQHWNKKKVYLLGFSQGANVLPFTVAELDEASQKALAKVVLISPEKFAQFEFHMTNWVKSTTTGLPVVPILQKHHGIKMLCIFGSVDKNSACPEVRDTEIEVHGFEGGHHLFQNISTMVSLIMAPANQ
ncbi:MAG TPA: AcvB/VirJ family lysyl-phosphatidylglycerol hydrolase [Candidatus Acidoferrum sp.]|nr:AcvB/VirJ family lysyl-phosphatidylglycerol hydrolase [Candidatus Acidoferrum sp.]